MSASNTEQGRYDHLVSLLYDDELSPAEAEALRLEIQDDPEAQATLRAWGEVQSAMMRLPDPEPDPQVHYEILRAARQTSAPVRRGFWEILAAWSLSPVAAGLGLLVLAGGMYTLFGMQDQAPSQFKVATSQAPQSEAPRGVVTAKIARSKDAPTKAAPSTTVTTALGKKAVDEPEAAKALARGEIKKDKGLELTFGEADAREAQREPAKPPLKAERKQAKGKRATKRAVETEGTRARRDTKEPKRSAKRRSARRPSKKRPKSKVAKRAPAPLDDLLDSAPDNYAPPPPPTGEPTPKRPAQARPTVVAQDEDQERAVNDRDKLNEAPEVDLAASPTAGAAMPPQVEAAKAEAIDSVGSLAVNSGAEPEPRARRAASPKDTTPQDASATLQRARAARAAGRLREAARAYDDFGRRFRRHGSFAQAMFEAAQTYERLGETTRAVKLYRLVVSSGGQNASAAQVRINQLSPPAQKVAEPPPQTRE